MGLRVQGLEVLRLGGGGGGSGLIGLGFGLVLTRVGILGSLGRTIKKQITINKLHNYALHRGQRRETGPLCSMCTAL